MVANAKRGPVAKRSRRMLSCAGYIVFAIVLISLGVLLNRRFNSEYKAKAETWLTFYADTLRDLRGAAEQAKDNTGTMGGSAFIQRVKEKEPALEATQLEIRNNLPSRAYVPFHSKVRGLGSELVKYVRGFVEGTSDPSYEVDAFLDRVTKWESRVKALQDELRR